jgi:hypothetical protein
MKIAATFLALIVLSSGAAGAQEGNGLRRHPLQLSSEDLFQLFEASDDSPPGELDRLYDNFLDHVENDRVSLRGFVTLLPGGRDEKREDDEADPPTFAFIAKAKGSTLVSFTRPGASIDPEDRVFLQRTVVTDILDERAFSLAVYEDHALDGGALRLVGFGARVIARPALRILGWGFRLQLFGSFHPEHGGTAYVAISGRPGAIMDRTTQRSAHHDEPIP